MEFGMMNENAVGCIHYMRICKEPITNASLKWFSLICSLTVYVFRLYTDVYKNCIYQRPVKYIILCLDLTLFFLFLELHRFIT